MKFSLTIKRGLVTVAWVKGIREVGKEELSAAELEKVIDVEQYLEKLLGLRFHIEEIQ